MAFNSQRTFRAPTFRSQLSIRRVYETLEPRSETKETDEAHFLHVYLPGYTKDQMRITLQDASQVLRISGERPIPGNRWRKFDQTYPVPGNSDAGTLEAKFEQGTLILKMLKKPTPQSQVVAPKQEVEKTQQDPSSSKDLDEAKLEKVQETIPPTQSTTKFEEPTQDMKSDSPQTQSIEKKTQEAIQDDTLSQIAKETISNNEPQKAHPEFVPKPTFKDTTKTQIDEKAQEGQQEFEKKSTSVERTKTQIDEKAQEGQQEFEKKTTSVERTKTQIDEKAQKVQEEFEIKPKFVERIETQTGEKTQKGQEEFEKNPTFIEKTKTQIDEKAQKSPEEFEKMPTFIEKTKTKIDENLQKGQEEFKPEPIEKVVTKEKLEEKIMRKSDEDEEEGERIPKKQEIEEKNEKPYESSKTMKDVKNENIKENEIEKAELPTPKARENEKESSSTISPNQEEKNGFIKLAAASTQLLTRMAEGKWSGDERHLIENVGAAVLIIAAFGAYISYRFSS